MEVEILSMRILGDWRDTLEATKIMKDQVNAIIVIGGDGTNRVVAKASDNVPIMPISTGTNNVFPYMIEATIAAEAVAAIATGIVKSEEGTYKAKRVEIFEDGELKDIALIDAAATMHSFVGSRAVWKPEYLKEIVVSICLPSNIGLSSISGIIKEIREDEDLGLYVELGEGKKIRAPIAPGVLREVSIKSYRTLELGEEVEIKTTPSLFALDGEREVEVEGEVTARVTRNGPRVIDYQKTLKIATGRGFFDG